MPSLHVFRPIINQINSKNHNVFTSRNWILPNRTMLMSVCFRGGSRVVQVICTNHSNFFQILFLSALLLLTKSITFLVLLFIMKLTKQLRDYSVDHTANPAPPKRSGRVTVRAVSSFVDLSRTTRKKFRRHDRTKFLPRG